MSEKQLGFVFKPELCIQCHACEGACRNWRFPGQNLTFRKVIAVEEGRFPDTRVGYYSLACMHCVDPECAKVCPVQAISKNEDGTVIVDRDLCIGCGVCESACPYSVPQYDSEGIMMKCDMCASISPEEQQSPCVRMCPAQALTRVYLTEEEKLEQEKLMLNAAKH